MISGSATAGYGVFVLSGGTVTNTGTVSAFRAVAAVGAAVTITNSGVLAGAAASGIGVDVRAGGLLTNQAIAGAPRGVVSGYTGVLV